MNIQLPHHHDDGLEKCLSSLPGTQQFTSAAGVFAQLSDVTRLRIIWILCHSEDCVTNIAAAIGMSDPAVSHHLSLLKKTGLAVSRRIGKEVHYSLAKTKEANLVHRMVDDIFEMDCPTCAHTED